GTYTNTIGCHTEILELTITPSTNNTTTESACDSFTWAVNGTTYTQSGTYSSTNDCATETLVLTITPLASAEFNYAQSVYCNGEMPPTPTAVSTGTFSSIESGLSIDQTTGEINIQGSTPGTYQVIHMTDGICSNTDTATITIIGHLNATWTLPTSVCQGAAAIDLQSSVTGDANGTWSGSGMNGSVFNPTASGTYELTYTVEDQGCTASSTLEYLVLGTVQAYAGPDAAVCGNSFQLEANNTSFGQWIVPSNISASSATSPNAVVSTSQSGTYTLIWSMDNGSCSDTDTISITFMDPGTSIWVDAGPDQNLEALDQTEVNGQGTSGAIFEWSVISGAGFIHSPNSINSPITDLAVGDNVFILTASIGVCSMTQDTLVIHVDDLFIPQAISPNGDGDNDLFVVTGMEAYPNSLFTVFNRWGLKVYENSDYANEWDGRSKNGMELPNDTYFYVLNLSNDKAYNGFVIIKR
ncbi:MAG: gliding motility-associated C-terminal domain-containing protein, partial [Flavobacteriales bacterium]